MLRILKASRNVYRNYIGNKTLREAILFPIIFIFFATAPLLWYIPIHSYTLLGSGDNISPINYTQFNYSHLFVYDPNAYDGLDFSFQLAQISPYNLFFTFFSFVGVTPSATTLIFLFFILLISEISMFFYLRNILIEKFENKNTLFSKMLCLFGGILYALSPYVISLIEPGHFIELLLYATAPLILIIVDQILIHYKYEIKKYVYLFFLFLFNAAAFSNIGIIYVLLVFLGLYYLPVTIINKSFLRNIPKFMLICLTIFLSNIWWLLPFISSLKATILLNQASNLITNDINIAVSKATVLNLLLARGDAALYAIPNVLPNNYYINDIILIIFLVLLFFVFYAIVNSKKYVAYIVQLLVLALGAIFISKGPNEPFGNVFIFFYNYIPGFQIFRRPVSKFYWVFLLSFIVLAIIGISIFLKKSKHRLSRIIIFTFLTISIIYLWIIFVLTPVLTPFNIPSYYYQASSYLQKQHVNRLFILPGFFGTYPTYDSSFNYFYGYDFLNYIWNISKLIPDSTAYSPNLPYKKESNILMRNIEENKPFCEETRNLGITHIMVRQDIDLNNPMQDKPKSIIQILDKSSVIKSYKFFTSNNKEGFTVYQLKNQCTTSNVILLNNSNKNVQFKMVNPVKYDVMLTHVRSGNILEILNNFSPAWTLYIDKYTNQTYDNKNSYQSNNIFTDFEDIKLLASKHYDEKYHIITKGYANGWKLNISDLKKIGDVKKNKDGTYTINIVLYYQPQLYFYIGLIIFFILLASLPIFIFMI